VDGDVSSLADYVANSSWKALPIAVYVVEPDGKFVDGNHKLCELLDIDAVELPSKNIESFYANRADRRKLLDAADTHPNIEKQAVPFIVRGRQIEVQVFCHAVQGGHDSRTLGYVGALVEVTAESKYSYLLDKHLPAGIYTLDADDRIVKANDGFAKLHGYPHSDDVIGLTVRDFYATPEQADHLKTRLISEGGIIRETVTLQKRNKQAFSAYVTAIAFIQDGQYTGRGGMVEDRTSEVETEALLDDIPVGFYSLETRDGRDRVVRCNRAFAEIHDYPSREAILGVDIRPTHADVRESRAFLAALERAATENRPVLGAKLRIRTPKDRLKIVEVNSRAKIRDGKVVGRTGAIRDITEEEKLRAEVDSLNKNIAAVTNDVDAVLHMFRQTLMQLNLSLRAVEAVFARSHRPDEPTPTDEEVEAEILGPLHAMLGGIPVFLDAARAANIDAAKTSRLSDIAATLSEYRTIPKPHWRDLWLEGAVEIVNTIAEISPGAIARSIYRPVAAAAEVVARIAGLATLRIARDAIIGVDAPVVSLREFVTSGTRRAEPREVLALTDVVEDAIRNHTPFATLRRVRIEVHSRAAVHLVAARGELIRAIGNLLHNAIKYSWQRDDQRTWIDVTVSSEPRVATIAVENWGVPIPEDEIADRLPFRLGYRGRLSSDRGRVGTGVGLPDALRVAVSHGGDVELQSRPAKTGSDPHDYSQPFITTVSLRLPLMSQGGRVSR
jgi:PAS domain S-box-containing protein